MNRDLYELSYSLKKDFQKKVASVVLFALSVFVLLNLVLSFLIFPLRQTSVSMTPDVSKDSVVLFSPLKHSCNRGDVVLVKKMNCDTRSVAYKALDFLVTFFTARQISIDRFQKLMGNSDQIRRIVGIPGDTIYMRDYVIYVKPAGEKFFLTEFELVEKPYDVSINAAPALWDSSIGVVGSFEQIELKEGQYFVLGDYRNSAIDSRMWGPVSSKNIRAGALFCYFPFDKIRIF